MKGFSLTEKKKLVEMAKDSKIKGYSLTRVFNDFAKNTNRASGSVRNYYYELIKEQEEVASGLYANKILPFTKCQTAKLISDILIMAGGGKSVRKCIKELAQSEKEALRMQNKYRNVIKHEKEFVKQIMLGLDKKGVTYLDPYKKQREKRGFMFNRLKREIDGLLERLECKEKLLNKELVKKVELLEEENKTLKEQSKVIGFYKKEDNVNV
ncbi:MAG: hypothetical protein J6C97_00170 [Clostridia bacterium]|nr:hypothetical protein [Clostridia bacterium]